MKWFFLFAILSCSLAAHSAIVLKLSQKNTKPEDQCTVSEIVDVSLFRADVTCKSGRETSMIFDSQKSMNYFVDHTKKTYFQTSLEDLKQISAKIAERNKEIQDKIDKRSNSTGPAGNDRRFAPVLTKKLDEKKTIGKFRCQPYIKTRSGEKIGETCVASWDQVKLNFSKYKGAIEAWRNFMENWQKGVPNLREGPGGSGLAAGFLVQEIDLDKGAIVKQTDFMEVKEVAIGPNMNAPPANYKKDVNPMLRGSRK